MHLWPRFSKFASISSALPLCKKVISAFELRPLGLGHIWGRLTCYYIGWLRYGSASIKSTRARLWLPLSSKTSIGCFIPHPAFDMLSLSLTKHTTSHQAIQASIAALLVGSPGFRLPHSPPFCGPCCANSITLPVFHPATRKDKLADLLACSRG